MNCRYLTGGGSVLFEAAVTKQICVTMVLDSTFVQDPGCPEFLHGFSQSHHANFEVGVAAFYKIISKSVIIQPFFCITKR
jgi:hypothetical protein